MHAVTNRRYESIDLLGLALGLQLNPTVRQVHHKARYVILFGGLGGLISKSHPLHPSGKKNGLMVHLGHGRSKTLPTGSDNPNLQYDPGILFACAAT